MRIKIILVILSTFFLLSGCQTVKQKTDAIVKKENEKLSKYISKPASVLQMEFLDGIFLISLPDLGHQEYFGVPYTS